MKNLNISLIAFIAILVLAMVYPVLIIWALNLFFPVLSIPYNIYTYIASLILFNKLNPIKISFNQ